MSWRTRAKAWTKTQLSPPPRERKCCVWCLLRENWCDNSGEPVATINITSLRMLILRSRTLLIWLIEAESFVWHMGEEWNQFYLADHLITNPVRYITPAFVFSILWCKGCLQFSDNISYTKCKTFNKNSPLNDLLR